MKESIRKGILAGIGLVDLSVEMAKASIDVLVKSGEMTAEQGRLAVEKLAGRAEKGAGELKRKVDEAIARSLEKISLVTLPRVEALEVRLAELEDLGGRVAELERIIDDMTGRGVPEA